MRSPGQPVIELKGHRGQVTSLSWGQSEGNMLATAGDDCQVLLWDVSGIPPNPSPRNHRQEAKKIKITEPKYAYSGHSEINNMAWSPVMPAMTLHQGFSTTPGEWLATASGRHVRMMKL